MRRLMALVFLLSSAATVYAAAQDEISVNNWKDFTVKPPHVILGIGPDSSIEETREQFLKLVKKIHPDKNPDRKEDAAEAFKLVSNAYNIFSEQQQEKANNQRQQEDMQRRQQQEDAMFRRMQEEMQRRQKVEEDMRRRQDAMRRQQQDPERTLELQRRRRENWLRQEEARKQEDEAVMRKYAAFPGASIKKLP